MRDDFTEDKKIENNHQETTKYLKSLPPPYSDSSSLFFTKLVHPKEETSDRDNFPN